MKPRRFRPSELTLCGTAGRPDRHDERRHIARHHGVVREEGVIADLRELMDGGQSAHDHPVAELDVAAERRAIRHHDLIAEACNRAPRANRP